MTVKDTVFRGGAKIVDFSFDAKVSLAFDDMVSRSVPFYAETQRLQTEMAVQFLPDADCLVVDLGCSTGTTLDLIASHPMCPPGARFLGIDNSPHMLAEARAKLAPHIESGRATLLEADANAVEIPPCNVVLMNWTLQFIRPLYREAVVRRISDALAPGGALFLSEKILVSDSSLNRLYIDLYLQYKRTQGYSDEEIRRKREALENVLVPYRIDENRALLGRSGFSTVDEYFRWCNFVGIVAIKGPSREERGGQ